jgi:hypothetical protein
VAPDIVKAELHRVQPITLLRGIELAGGLRMAEDLHNGNAQLHPRCSR